MKITLIKQHFTVLIKFFITITRQLVTAHAHTYGRPSASSSRNLAGILTTLPDLFFTTFSFLTIWLLSSDCDGVWLLVWLATHSVTLCDGTVTGKFTVSWGNHCGPQHFPVSSVLFTLISDYIGSGSRARSHYFSSLPGVPELHHDWITGSKCWQVSACLLVKVEFLLLLTRDHFSVTLLEIAMSWL